jgi:hypothetical protein
MLDQVEAGHYAQNLKMDILQGIKYVIQAWNEITALTIANCWNHTKILPTNYDVEIADESDDLIFDELAKGIEVLQFAHPMKAKEFLTIPEEDIVYEVPEGDNMIEELVDMFKTSEEESVNNPDEADDSIEIAPINANTALQSVETVRMFLFQHENGGELVTLTNRLEKFIRETKVTLMKQTTMDQYIQQ